nr:MAG TPA: hypothetical protein [Caudoviricetes sp.]
MMASFDSLHLPSHFLELLYNFNSLHGYLFLSIFYYINYIKSKNYPYIYIKIIKISKNR